MKRNSVLYFISIMLLFGLWACNGSQEVEQQINDKMLEPETSKKSSEMQQFFQLPSPVELFMFMWDGEMGYNPNHLNLVDNAKLYEGSKNKAINLGVYSADLAYCTVYEKNQEARNLFSASIELAQNLGLTEGFDSDLLDRIDHNIENSDSLFQITNQSYSQSLTYLQSQNQVQILPYIVYGGWLESLYIATQSLKKENLSNDVAGKIVDQAFLLENLIEFFEYLNYSDEKTLEIVDDLSALEIIFENIVSKGDGSMSENNFSRLKNKVNEIRLGIVK